MEAKNTFYKFLKVCIIPIISFYIRIFYVNPRIAFKEIRKKENE